MTVGRWRTGLSAALALVGVGLLFAEPTLLGAAVVPLVYVCYGVVSGLSTAPTLRATRSFDPGEPGPGERVTVRLHVENTGNSVLPDLRIVDGVPNLAVVGGSPRTATALAPGETATVSYSVVPRRGEHEFDGPLVRARSVSASTVHTERVDVESGATLTCVTPARDRLSETVVRRVGRLSAGGRGDGTEFHAVREYRRGDPMRRIDWRHVAKTGEFVTVEYRDQQATETAVVVDIREPGRTRPAAGHPSGVSLAAEAADRLLTALDRSNVLAGLGVAGVDPGGPLSTVGSVAWAGTASRRSDPSVLLEDVRARIETDGVADASGAGSPTDASGGDGRRPTARVDGGAPGPTAGAEETGEASAGRPGPGANGTTTGALAGADSTETGSDTRPETAGTSNAGTASSGTDAGSGSVDQLLGQIPPQTQVVLCTPALDNWAVAFGRAATARGHGLVVLSPNITGSGDAGTRLAGLRRRLRLRTLDQGGEVVDWTPGRSVSFDTGGVN
jgi:hypothetical protein